MSIVGVELRLKAALRKAERINAELKPAGKWARPYLLRLERAQLAGQVALKTLSPLGLARAIEELEAVLWEHEA